MIKLPSPPKDTLYSIRLLSKEKRAIIVPPKPRPGSKQLTVLRHDDKGVLFVDNFVERMPGWMSQSDRRQVNHIFCSNLLHREVALTCCNHYCAFPCRDHSEALKERGWFHGSGGPVTPATKRRGGTKDED